MPIRALVNARTKGSCGGDNSYGLNERHVMRDCNWVKTAKSNSLYGPMRLGMFTRPAEVFAILDVKLVPTSNVIIRCPLDDMAQFTDQATDRHNHGCNVLYIGGNVGRLNYNQLRSNHNDCWGHYSR